MAAPSIRGQTAPVAGGTVTSPAGTQVGDLVIVYTFERLGAAAGSTLSVNGGAGFTQIRNHFHDDSTTDGALAIAYKVATQAGAQSYQGFTSSTGSPAWWTGCTVLQAGTFDTTALASNGVTQTTNAVPNPPSVTGLSATRQYLVLAIAAWHLGSSVTNTATAPTNYTNLVQLAGAATADLACASRAVSAVTSEDPGTYGDDQAPNGTCALTVAIGNALPGQGSGAAALAIGASAEGRTVKSGFTALALTLALAGVGASVHVGTGTAGIVPGTAGAGRTVHTGSGAPLLPLGATGVGEAPLNPAGEGSGVAVLELTASGTGTTRASGAGVAGLLLSASGAGTATHCGSGGAAVTLGVGGLGETPHRGSGAALLAAAAEGEGRSTHHGFSITTLVLATQAIGRTVHTGSGNPAVTLAVGGAGAAPAVGVADGFGVATLGLSSAGEGQTVAAGGGQSTLPLVVQGDGSAPVIATPPGGSGVLLVALDGLGVGRTARRGSGVVTLSLTGVGWGLDAEAESREPIYGSASAWPLLLGTDPAWPVIQGTDDGD